MDREVVVVTVVPKPAVFTETILVDVDAHRFADARKAFLIISAIILALAWRCAIPLIGTGHFIGALGLVSAGLLAKAVDAGERLFARILVRASGIGYGRCFVAGACTPQPNARYN
jgi:hypothetical protein